MRRWTKILLWTVGVVLALLLLVSLLAGPLVKGYVNSHGEQLTGRKVEVERVGVNLLTGHAFVRGLALYEEDGREVFASFDTLDVRARWLKLLVRTVDLRRVTLAGFDAHLLQEGERFNFSSMVEHFASKEENDDDTTGGSWVVKLYNIRLSHARVDYREVNSGKCWGIADMNLHTPGFVLGGDESSRAGLNVALAEGGKVSVDANYDAASNGYTLNLNIEDFDLRNVRDYVAEVLAAEEVKGVLNARVMAEGRVDELLDSRLKGHVGVRELDVKGEGGQSVLKWEGLQVEVTNINVGKRVFDISSVALSSPEVRYEKWADHNNMSSNKATKNDSVATEEAPRSAPPAMWRIGSLLLTDGSVEYVDHTLPDEVDVPIRGVRVELKGEGTGGVHRARVDASLPRGGEVAVRWSGQIGRWKESQDLRVNVRGVDMKLLSPWVTAYTGQPIEEGVLGLASHTTISRSLLESENAVDIYKVRVGARRKDVEPEQRLPLKSALYVLKDKDDKIQLEIPVKGNVDNPEFNYMKAVWKTLGNLLVKVVTSPIRMVGNALGFGHDELEFIKVESGQKELTSEQYHTLSRLAEVAKYDSTLMITMKLHTRSGSEDVSNEWGEALNKQVVRYMNEQGVGSERFAIKSAGEADTLGRTGYSVEAEMIIEEE